MHLKISDACKIWIVLFLQLLAIVISVHSFKTMKEREPLLDGYEGCFVHSSKTTRLGFSVCMESSIFPKGEK